MSTRVVRSPDRQSLSPAQCRAARGLLGWDQAVLAERARVSRGTIMSFEGETRTPIAATIAKLRACFEAEGVRFIAEGGEEGCVVFRKE